MDVLHFEVGPEISPKGACMGPAPYNLERVALGGHLFCSLVGITQPIFQIPQSEYCHPPSLGSGSKPWQAPFL